MVPLHYAGTNKKYVYTCHRCVCLFGTGLYNLIGNADALNAFNPAFAFQFLFTRGEHGFRMLGSVVLAITGCEAMYAGMIICVLLFLL